MKALREEWLLVCSPFTAARKILREIRNVAYQRIMYWEKRRLTPNHGTKHRVELLAQWEIFSLPTKSRNRLLQIPKPWEPTSALWQSTLLLAPLLGSRSTASPRAGKLPLQVARLTFQTLVAVPPRSPKTSNATE